MENTSIALNLHAQEVSVFVIQEFLDGSRKCTNKILVSILYVHTDKYDNVLHFCLH